MTNPSSPTIHGMNAIALTAPAATMWAHAPEVVTVIVGGLGCVWYAILITEKILYWVGKHNNAHPDEAAKDAPEPRIDLPHKN